jgi:hypothetical protein
LAIVTKYSGHLPGSFQRDLMQRWNKAVARARLLVILEVSAQQQGKKMPEKDEPVSCMEVLGKLI